jgi:hypothetical protein
VNIQLSKTVDSIVAIILGGIEAYHAQFGSRPARLLISQTVHDRLSKALEMDSQIASVYGIPVEIGGDGAVFESERGIYRWHIDMNNLPPLFLTNDMPK